MPSKHVLYGGSSAEIWRHCTGWAGLIQQMPRKPVGMAAHEGTAQHQVMEQLLKDPEFVPDKFLGGSIPTEGGEIELHSGHIAAITVALREYENVLDTYDHDEQENELQVFSERFVSGGPDDEGGTIDSLIVQAPRASFVDFKFGQLEVEAEGWQNYWYMICARREMPSLFRGVQEWESVIIQPAFDPAVDKVVIPTSVLDRMEEEARIAIAASKGPNPHFIEGDWCRWCDAKLACPAKTQKLGTLTLPNHVLDLAETEKLLMQLRGWKKWQDEAEERIHHELQHGYQGTCFKLVNKRGERRWIDEAAVVSLLKKKRIPAKDYMVPATLHSPHQMEERGFLKKSEITKEMAQVYSSGTTIAPLSDKRPAILPIGALAQALKR